MTSPRNLAIDGDRLWASIMAVAEIGATAKGGSRRLALTDLDREARDLFVGWCRAAGCTVTVDRMGNIFARRAGRNDALDPVVTGSHLDTQPTGGRFDGVYGVLAGLELVRSLNDLSIETERPLEVVCWTNEEGSRFAPSMVASGVFAGKFALDDALAKSDPDGLTIGGELARIGYAGDAPVGGRKLHAYFEAHIEQGPILEAGGETIGIVTGGQGQRWYEVTLTGVESHAGPTPMDRRRDALLGAARIVELVNRIGLDRAPLACATVGVLENYPNSRNVIPGRVFLTVDLRHPDDAVLTAMDAALRARIAAIAGGSGLATAIEEVLYSPPVAFDPTCVDAVRRAAAAHGFRARDIVSGAGHDACNIAAVAPAAMIFIPCIGGISHNEIEDAKPEWVTAGAQVLLDAVLDAAGTTR
ncbi:MAG: Zn-dependent hydrolase [Alphaproteobacteria bacterium]|nr:Zn-dependent hydrolase [Alphaproteobacteria bacterium]